MANSYRKRLFELLNTNNDKVTFVGTQKHGENAAWSPCEAYSGNNGQGGDVKTLTSKIQNDRAVQNLKANVALVLAGMQDFIAGKIQSTKDVDSLVDALENLIGEIHSQRRQRTILLAQISPLE